MLDICPWLTEKILRLAAQRLPNRFRERYLAEWLADYDYLRPRRGKLLMLLWALGVYSSLEKLTDILREAPPETTINVVFQGNRIFYGDHRSLVRAFKFYRNSKGQGWTISDLGKDHLSAIAAAGWRPRINADGSDNTQQSSEQDKR